MNKFVPTGLIAPASDSDSFDFPSLSHFGHADAITVPDTHLLFSGDYMRLGNDLIISDPLHRFVLQNYFSGEKRPMLISPEGAALDQRFVEALTGHVTYAQAGAAAPGAKVVGHVVKMTGSASIVRNGVAIVVNTGDNVYQNDVVQTGSNSTLGLVLDEGTAFNLSANTRFMLNELTYDQNSTSNSSLTTLIQDAVHSRQTVWLPRQTFMKSAQYAGFIDASSGRFVKPGIAAKEESQQHNVDDGKKKRNNDSDGNEPPDLHPFVQGHLKELPKAGEVRPEAQWLDSPASILIIRTPRWTNERGRQLGRPLLLIARAFPRVYPPRSTGR